MKRATRKFLSAFLALSMVLAILPVLAPQTAYAADASDLKIAIESYIGGTGAIGGPLTATVDGNTVTVTGSITNVSETLTLSIDEGVTVDWQASLESAENFSPRIPETPTEFRPLIMLEGAGSLTVSGNGKIAAHSAVAIRASIDATVAITVEGSGCVTTTGESTPYTTTIQFYRTIETHGNVTVKDSAFLSTDRSTVIYAQGEASQVTISGGTLQNNATHYSNPVVRTLGESSKVTVCGTGEVHAYTQNGYAVSAKGDVEVSGSAKISAVAGGSAVSVSGNGSEVSVYGGTITGVGSAIDGGISSATVVTIDGGSVTSTGSRAISISSSPGSSATISGGTVGNGTADGNSTYTAISAHTINVSGGTVYGYTTSSFGVIFGTNVNISGTAKVQAKVDGAPAIYGGFVDITGGEVSATTGGAVYNSSENGFVTVSGGRVFAYAGTIRSTSNVGVLNFYNYYFDDTEKPGFTGATGTGMVIGWNKAAGNTNYTAGTSDDIVKSPDAATAVWGKSGDENGIFYNNGSNTGFIPLEVTVMGGDTTAPELSAGSATRTSATEATIGFTTDEVGTAYYKAVESGAAAPDFSVSDWTSIGAVSGTVTDKGVALTAGAKDIYVVVQGIFGNASDALKIAVGAIYPKNPVPTMEVYVWGNRDFSGNDIVDGALDERVNSIITYPQESIALGGIVGDGIVRLSGVAEGTTSIVVNVDGINITVPISVVEPPDDLKPVLSAGSASRTSDTEATIGFTTSKAGVVFYLVQEAGADAPVIPEDIVSFKDEGSIEAGAVSLPVSLTAGAKDVYVLFFEETYMLPSEILKIEVAAYSVSGIAPAITTTTLPNGTVGTSYSASLTATGDTPIAWSLDSGNLPDGLNLSANGLISGTPTATGTFNFTVKASNAAGDDTKALSTTINAAAPTVDSVTVTPASAEVEKGTTQQFGATVTGTNNPATTVTWTISAPLGYSGNSTISSSGLLAVDAGETETTLTVRATSTVDSTKYGEVTVTVTDSPPTPVYSISLDRSGTHTFPAATENYGAQTPLSVTVTNTGTQPTGELSIGLSGTGGSSFTVAPDTISSIATATGATFTVTPETGLSAGTHTATITVSGDNSISESFDVSFTVNSATPSGTAPSITTTALPSGVVGSAYNATLAATGDTPITWAVDSGSLPDGLTLNETTGVISGTPTAAGTANFTLGATNDTGNDARAFSITIEPVGITAFTITAAAGIGGSISPAGSVSVNNGASQVFYIVPNRNYSIGSVSVDGVSVGAVSSYTFNNVTANHTIAATFSYNGDADPVPGEDDATPPAIIAITATPYGQNGVFLSITATDASLPLSYQWQMKGSWIDIPGATSAWFDYTGLEAGKNYTVRVKVTDAKGNQTTSEPITFKAGAAAITGLPESYTLLVGQSVKWTPAPAGGEWSYDNAYLSLTGSGGKAVFKALKEGKTTATYTAGGTEYVVHITINAATLPQTGDSGSPLPYILLSLASLCGLGAVLLWRKRSHA